MSDNHMLNKIIIGLVLLGLGIMFISSFSYRLGNPSLIKRVSERQASSEGFGQEGMNTGMTQELMAHIGALMEKLAQNPDSFEVRVELAEHFMEAQDWVSAEQHLTRAISGKPDDAAANYNLGVALYQQGKFSESAARFEKILQQHEDPGAMFNLAILYYQHLDQKDKGVALFKRVAESSDADLKERAGAILESI